jgi:hypothetical protein
MNPLVSKFVSILTEDTRSLSGRPGAKLRGFRIEYWNQATEALNIIDQVHADGRLRLTSVLCSLDLPSGTNGVFDRTSDEIHLHEGDFVATTLIHEIGHLLDCRALGADTYSSAALNSGVFAVWRDAVVETKTHERLREFEFSKQILVYSNGQHHKVNVPSEYRAHAAYLASFPECFARLYLQWVVHKSNSSNLYQELERRKREDISRTFLPYWTDLELKVLFPIMERVFSSLGWLGQPDNSQ